MKFKTAWAAVGGAVVSMFCACGAGSGMVVVEGELFEEDETSGLESPSGTLANAGFEDGGQGWENWGNARVVREHAHSGKKSLRIGTGEGGRGQRISGLRSGARYRLTVWAKLSESEPGADIGVTVVGKDGKEVSFDKSVSSSAYQLVSVPFTTPADFATAKVWSWKGSGRAYLYVDDFSLTLEGSMDSDAGVESPPANPPSEPPTSPSCPGFGPPPRTGGTTLYVEVTGSDANPGTESKPFRTIQKAANVVNPGDVVVVGDGTYTDSLGGVMVYVTRGGTASNWVTFKSKNRWGAKLDGSGGAYHGFFFDPVSYVQVEGFDISGTKGINNGGAAGIHVHGSHDVRIVANRIHHIGRQCSDTGYGLDAMFVDGDRILVEGNLVHDIGRFELGENGCNPANGNYKNHDHGIYLHGGQDLRIQNNIFHRHGRGWAMQLYPNALKSVSILYNTFAFPNAYREGHIVLATSITSSRIQGNIFYRPTSTMLASSSGSAPNNLVVSDNLTTAGSVIQNAAGISASSNQLNTDPMFVNADGADFRLRSGSPALGRGPVLADVKFDFGGCVRASSGAYALGALGQ